MSRKIFLTTMVFTFIALLYHVVGVFPSHRAQYREVFPVFHTEKLSLYIK